MKRQLTKLSALQATLLISGIISCIFLAISSICFIFDQPGWMIGIALGGLVSLGYIFLTDISTQATLKDSKAGLFLLAYFAKMILFVGIFAMLVIFDYKLRIDAFKNSFWGMIIGFFPTVLITIAVQVKHKGGSDGQVL